MKIVIILLLFISIILFGTIGYHLIQGWSLIDSLYMTVITISTVGYKEIEPLSIHGKIFTIILIIFALFLVTKIVQLLFTVVVELNLNADFKRRRIIKMINKMKNHYILCGYGEMGKVILQELLRYNKEVVVLDKNEHIAGELEKFNGKVPYIIGDAASDDNILVNANIKNAKGFIAALDNDANNLFAVLSARQLNPELIIVSKCNKSPTESKLKNAGANFVIFSTIISGVRMATAAVNPNVINFLDILTSGGKEQLKLEEFKIPAKSYAANKSLMELQIPHHANTIVIALKKHETNNIIFNPVANTVIQENDAIIVLGDDGQLKKLQNFITQKV
jgi:voltage-gated potassium channel